MTKEDSWMITQGMQPDRFFSSAQQQQLTRLMAEWRSQCNQGQSLPPQTQQELEALVEAELLASAARAIDMRGACVALTKTVRSTHQSPGQCRARGS
jgi:hypothetical protein